MKKYYVNNTAQTNGDHEVHEAACRYYPYIQDKTYLGEFWNCSSAVTAAKNHHQQVNGCVVCSPACHTQ